MTVLAAGASRPRRATRPQLVAEVVAVGGWVLLLAHPLAVAAGVHAHDRPTLASWTVMAAAMMLPGAIPAARHVAVNSLRWRRHRAVALYVAAYVGVWVGYGAVVVPASRAWRPPLAAVLAVAAAWQLTPWHRRAVRDCHRTVPLPPTGWAATKGSLRFGARNARACVGTCWASMLVMVAAPADSHLVWAVVLALAVFAQKTARRPRRTARGLGAAFGLGALVTTAGGGAWPLAAAAVVVVLLGADADQRAQRVLRVGQPRRAVVQTQRVVLGVAVRGGGRRGQRQEGSRDQGGGEDRAHEG